jgi:uncharacterized integral membrane protein
LQQAFRTEAAGRRVDRDAAGWRLRLMALLRWIVGGVLFVALLFLSLQNSELVTVRFYHWFSWQAPLIFLLLIAFAAGVAAGLLASLVRSARLRRQLGRLRKEHRRALASATQTPADSR